MSRLNCERQTVTAGASAVPLLIETSRALPLVNVTVALRSGSVLDPKGSDGLCRLAARLMRRTGGGVEPQVLDARIDGLGGSFGVDVSHSTVAFQATVIARSFESFIDLMEDVLARPGLDSEELERLKRETESELIDTLDNDRALVRRWFRRQLFGGHPYSRGVQGTIGTIRSANAEGVSQLLRRMIVRDNVVFAFAGDVDSTLAAKAAIRIIGALSPGAAPPDLTPEPPSLPGRRLVVVDKPERTQTQILIGGLGTHPRDPDHIALHVASTILGGTFTARLMREIRSERGWSYGAYSSLPFDRHRQAFSLWTFPKSEDAAACIRLELDMLASWIRDGVTEEELTWAKRYLVRSHAFALDTAQKRVSLLLDEVVYDLPPGYHEHYCDAVMEVTLEQANAAVARRISSEDLLVTVVGTQSQVGAALRESVAGLASYEVVPFDRDG
ncbi:M16 family metallopeptidase [Myxococcota bacterium]